MSHRRQTPVVVPPPSPTPQLTNLDPVDEEVFDPVITPDNPTLTLEDPIVEAQVPLPDDPISWASLALSSIQDEVTANLAIAIQQTTQELHHRETQSTKRAKAKEPDTFDGTDPRKLNNFILLCNLYFHSNPAYSDDSAKVTFALSYLQGMALEYFEPAITDFEENPEWLEDWTKFVRTLRTQFGPINPTGDAESGLDLLKMQDNQHLIKYNIEFNQLSVRTNWNDAVLQHRYYSSL